MKTDILNTLSAHSRPMSPNALIHSTLRLFGKNYAPDAGLPLSFFARMALRRSLWLMRGFMRTGKKCFIGPRVTIEGSGNLHLGHWVTFENDVRINAITREKMALGDHVKIGAFSRVLCSAHFSKVGRRFVMGQGSACGEFCYFGAAGGISIGENVLIGQYVSFHAQDHVFAHPYRPIQEQGVTEKGIEVANDCWIGAK